MKNFFKVLSLSVVAAFMLASCEEEEAQIEPRHEKNIPSYADKIIEIPNPIVKKVVYDVSYASLII